MATRRLARIFGLAALGIVSGLAVSELVFRTRDGGAFPQLNVFVADPTLGVRLRPGATETVRFGGPRNPATSVRIGAHGYRGEARPPAEEEVLAPLTPDFQKLTELAKAQGARLIVLVLPIDVMVSAEEWRKYGRDPAQAPKLDDARGFVDDLVASARDVGAEALDVRAVLAAAEPGAFLDADIHLTPKGHDVVATALAKLLSTPPEPALARPGLPPGAPHPRDSFRGQSPRSKPS